MRQIVHNRKLFVQCPLSLQRGLVCNQLRSRPSGSVYSGSYLCRWCSPSTPQQQQCTGNNRLGKYLEHLAACAERSQPPLEIESAHTLLVSSWVLSSVCCLGAQPGIFNPQPHSPPEYTVVVWSFCSFLHYTLVISGEVHRGGRWRNSCGL